MPCVKNPTANTVPRIGNSTSCSSTVRDLVTKYPEYTISVIEGITRKGRMSLYAFGMPKVGDRGYALAHNKLVNNSWRVVNRKDPVSHYPISTGPPDGLFHHRTEVYYANKNLLPTDSNYVVCMQAKL